MDVAGGSLLITFYNPDSPSIQKMCRPLAHAILVTFLAIAALSNASAQITVLTESHGKEIWCTSSGLHGFETPCGADNYHEFVLTGTILSITPVEKDESRITIQPNEVFWGKPPATLSALTNERDCMPDLHIGDQWLFNLYRNSESKSLILEYGHGSLPVADAADTLARLRRLQTMSETGLIRGYIVFRDFSGNDSETLSPANRKVIARRESDNKEYTALSDAKGDFEFEPLPIGKYDISANTDPPLWAEEGDVNVKPHSCSAIDFHLVVDAQISGKLLEPSGTPLAEIEVEAVEANQDVYPASTWTDAQGNFILHGLPPSDYTLKITLQSIPYDKTKTMEVFYPGVSDKTKAEVIHIQPGQIVKLPDLPKSERMTRPVPAL
jgi:hypothetical protein